MDVAKKANLHRLNQEGWPQFKVTVGAMECTTLYALIRRLRSAVAHGHLTFSSDSRNTAEVMIVVEDYRPREDVPHWRAEFGADALRCFCLKLIEFIDGYLG